MHFREKNEKILFKIFTLNLFIQRTVVIHLFYLLTVIKRLIKQSDY